MSVRSGKDVTAVAEKSVPMLFLSSRISRANLLLSKQSNGDFQRESANSVGSRCSLFRLLVLTICLTLVTSSAAFLVGCSRPPEGLPVSANTRQSEQSPGVSEVEPSQSVEGPEGDTSRKKGPFQPGRSIALMKPPGNLSSSLSSQAADKVASFPTREPSRGPTIEKISGYKTGGEYFVLPSPTFPQAMAVVTLPYDYDTSPEKKYPLVIVFGGAGECAKPPRSGALAWMHYYKTDEAVHALQKNHLEASDFRGLVKPSELQSFNTRLKKHPYGGVILACPYSALLSLHARLETEEYESFIIQELIPALKSRYRISSGGLGVDGVSMGGARSMYYGFKYPEVFSSIGSVQGAFGPYMDIYSQLVTKNSAVLQKRAIQLVSSDKDPMQPSVEKMHQLLSSHNIKHLYLTLTGPHDYIFNQGPGALALLVFHNQVLAQRPSGPMKHE